MWCLLALTCSFVVRSLITPQVYDTSDHDRHHSLVQCNFSFPFPFLDMLHGTYTGECWGRRFVAGKGVVGFCDSREEQQRRRRQ